METLRVKQTKITSGNTFIVDLIVLTLIGLHFLKVGFSRGGGGQFKPRFIFQEEVI